MGLFDRFKKVEMDFVETPDEAADLYVERNASIQNSHGVLLGKDTDENLILTVTRSMFGNDNMAVVASENSDKYQCLVIPHMLEAIRKGESFIYAGLNKGVVKETIKLAQVGGYIIKLIDLSGDPTKAYGGIDILSSITNEEQASAIATILLENSTDLKEPDEQADAELTLLTLLLNYAVSFKNTSYYHGLTDVYDMLSGMNHDQVEQIAYGMADQGSAAAGQYVAHDEKDRFAAHDLLKIRFAALGQSDVRTFLSVNNIDPALPAAAKCAYYLILPEREDLRFISALYVHVMLNAVRQYRSERPVLTTAILSDFDKTGIVSGINTILSGAAQLPLRADLFFANLPVLQNLYRYDWQGIMRNCGIWIYLSNKNHELMDNATGNFFYQHGLLVADMLDGVSSGEMVVRVDDNHFEVAGKYNYREHPLLRKSQ